VGFSGDLMDSSFVSTLMFCGYNRFEITYLWICSLAQNHIRFVGSLFVRGRRRLPRPQPPLLAPLEVRCG
jgi:hypothetical protein